MTFTDAAAILQNSPDEVELIVSQPKRKIRSVLSPLHAQSIQFSSQFCPQSIIMCSVDTMQPIFVPMFFAFSLLAESLRDSKGSLSQSTLGLALEKGFGSQTTLSGAEYRPAMEELEEAITLSNMATPKMGKRLHIPVVRIHDAQVRATAQPTVVRDQCFHGSKVVRSQGQG